MASAFRKNMNKTISCALGSAIPTEFWFTTHVDMIDMTYKNIIGYQVRRLRNMMNLSQNQLAARLQRCGLDIDRSRLSKIESRLVYVSDYEQIFFAEALKVSIEELYPESVLEIRSRLWDAISQMMRRDPRTFVPRKRRD